MADAAGARLLPGGVAPSGRRELIRILPKSVVAPAEGQVARSPPARSLKGEESGTTACGRWGLLGSAGEVVNTLSRNKTNNFGAIYLFPSAKAAEPTFRERRGACKQHASPDDDLGVPMWCGRRRREGRIGERASFADRPASRAPPLSLVGARGRRYQRVPLSLGPSFGATCAFDRADG